MAKLDETISSVEVKNGELRIVATVKWSQIFYNAFKYYLLHAVSWVLEKVTKQSSLKTSKLRYEIDDKIFFKSVKFLSQDFALCIILLDNVSLCTGKKPQN